MNKPKKPIGKFFILTYIITLPIYLFGILAAKGIILTKELSILSIPLITIAPIIAASILTHKEGGSVKELLWRSFDYKRITRKKWYLPVIFLLPVIFILAFGAMVLFAVPYSAPMFPIIALPVVFLVFFFLALFEEVGWMGYAFDPMQDRWNAFKASTILGTIWAVLHLPFFIFVGPAISSTAVNPVTVAGLFICLLGTRVLLVWIYNNTGKSVFAAILFHATYNVANALLPNFNSVSGAFITGILLVITAIIVIFLWGTGLDKSRWRLAK